MSKLSRGCFSRLQVLSILWKETHKRGSEVKPNEVEKPFRDRVSEQTESSLRVLQIELLFEEEIEENNLFLAASLAYFFGVLLACLTQAVETYFGIILILTAIMIIWYLRDKRKEIRRKYEKQIETLLRKS